MNVDSVRLSIKEKRVKFYHLLIIYLTVGGTVLWIVFNNYNYPATNMGFIAEKIDLEKDMLKKQQELLPLLDSTYSLIKRYRPEERAVFVETDINSHINNIELVYESSRSDFRYKSFDQIAKLYKIIYLDKTVLWSKKANIQLFGQRLQECEAGLNGGSAIPNPIISEPEFNN